VGLDYFGFQGVFGGKDWYGRISRRSKEAAHLRGEERDSSSLGYGKPFKIVKVGKKLKRREDGPGGD